MPEQIGRLFKRGMVRQIVNIHTKVRQFSEFTVQIANVRMRRNDVFKTIGGGRHKIPPRGCASSLNGQCGPASGADGGCRGTVASPAKQTTFSTTNNMLLCFIEW